MITDPLEAGLPAIDPAGDSWDRDHRSIGGPRLPKTLVRRSPMRNKASVMATTAQSNRAKGNAIIISHAQSLEMPA
ncbi:MAG: hypothetical protein ACKN94_04575, partial [Pirellulaceae bacterium]